MMIENLFGDINVPIIVGFLVLFAVLFFIVDRSVFGKNRVIGFIISGGVSVLAIWGLVNYTEFFSLNIFDFFYDANEWFAGPIMFFWIILVAGAIWSAVGLRVGFIKGFFSRVLITAGSLLLFIGAMPLIFSYAYIPDWINDIYETIGLGQPIMGFLVGIVLIVIGNSLGRGLSEEASEKRREKRRDRRINRRRRKSSKRDKK